MSRLHLLVVRLLATLFTPTQTLFYIYETV
jgi:hypothetical protein